MNLNANIADKLYERRLMVPPGNTLYFFTIDGVESISYADLTQEQENPYVENVEIEETTNNNNATSSIKKVTCFLPEINFLVVEKTETQIIHPEYYQPLVMSKPRTQLNAKKNKPIKIIKSTNQNWDIQKSIFL